MISHVTIQGSCQETIRLGYDSKSNLALARQLAAQITAGVQAGTIVTEHDHCEALPSVPAGVSGALVQSRSETVFLPPGYTIDLVTKPGHAVVFGSGAPDEIILSDARTDLAFTAASGSGTVVAGGGNDRLSVSGSGDWSLYTGRGNDVIAAIGAVSATIGAGGGHNAIQLGSGTDLIISTGKDSITAGSGAETVDATRARRDVVDGNGSRLLFLGGAGGVTIFGGSGSDTYLGSDGHTGRQLIVGGTSGNNILSAGDGAATLIGGGSGDQLFASGHHIQTLIAGAGSETLCAAGSSRGGWLQAGSGNDLLIGGAGSDTFVGGSGSATVQAGAGRQVFEFLNHHAGGTELVQGISDPNSIRIDLDGYGCGEVDRALAGQTACHGSVTVGLSDGTKITFNDVAALSRSNFT